jgi:hypothetical protein
MHFRNSFFFKNLLFEKTKDYMWTSLYAIYRDQKICLAYNEFVYNKIKNDCKLGDMFQKYDQLAIADMQIRR